VTLEFEGDELKPAVDYHLETGCKVQDYIKAAIRFFEDMRKRELAGQAVGWGDNQNFARYNTKVSPTDYLKAPTES
jgi:hypothetical protein